MDSKGHVHNEGQQAEISYTSLFIAFSLAKANATIPCVASKTALLKEKRQNRQSLPSKSKGFAEGKKFKLCSHLPTHPDCVHIFAVP